MTSDTTLNNQDDRDRLDGYRFNENIYPYLVETPRHRLHECAVRD